MMTTIEAFEKAAAHLLKQGVRSARLRTPEAPEQGTVCMYHGPDGKRCAVGALIPDELYDFDMEFKPVRGLTICKQINEAQMRMLGHLQILHDEEMPRNWERELEAMRQRIKCNAYGDMNAHFEFRAPAVKEKA